MSIYHDKFGNVHDFLPNEIYSVSVKYIFDYKVKFLRYTRTYSLNGRGRRGMIKTFFF